MNKYFGVLAALCALLMLCSCSQPQEEAPAEELPAVESQPPPQSGILSDVGQAETLQEYYDRTAVIGRNEWMEGGFTQTENWALEYAALEYPGSTATANYASGYVLPDAMTQDDLSGGVAVWDLTVETPSGETVKEQVQVFYFREWSGQEERLCFSGLLTGEKMLGTRPESYAYLALDTRFASRMQTLPDVTAPEGIWESEFTLEGEALDQQFHPLNDKVMAVLCRYSRGYESEDKLLVYDLESSEVLQEKWLTGFWECADTGDGWVKLEHYYGVDDLRLVLTVRLTEDGVLLEEERIPYSQYRVGESLLTWQDGSIFLGEEVLLQGSTGEEAENGAEMAMYNFHQALDDHRFLFSKAGWEWIDYYGIYDLESRTVHALTSPLQQWNFNVLQVSADGKRALAACGGYSRWGMTMVDLETLEQQILPVGHDSEETAVETVTANEDLSRIAVLDLNVDNTGVDHIRVYDTVTGAELFAWDVPAELVAGDPELQLVGENTLLVNLRQWKTDTEWIYRITY